MSSVVGTTSSSGSISGGTPTTVPYPAGIAAGDVSVLAVYDSSGANVLSAPSGWVKQAEWNCGDASFGSHSSTMHLFTRTYVAGDAAPSITPVSGYLYVLTTVRGVTGFGGLGATTADRGSTSVSMPSVTVGVAGAMVLGVAGSFHPVATTGQIDLSTPSGWAEAAEAFDSTTGGTPTVNLAVFYKTVGVSAASGAATSTKGNAGTSSTTSSQGVQLWLTETNLAPTAPTPTGPVGGATIDRTITQRFAWTFNDPNTGDSQSAFDLRYRIGAGAWTTVSGTTPNSFYDFAPSALTAASYEWQVRTYDSQGAVSPYSSSAFFTAANPPSAPTITSPTSGSTVSASAGAITWSYPSQESYQVRKVADSAGIPDTATVYFDSGEVVSTTARSASLTFPVNGRFEHLQVRVKTAGLWSTWASVRVSVSYTPPATPSLIITADSAHARITVAITDPTPTGSQPAVTSHDVYRRVSGSAASTRLAASVVGSSWVDYTPASGVAYEYQVVAHGSNSADSNSAWSS